MAFIPWQRNGLTVLEYFHEMAIPITETGCWIWTGYCNENGYGRIHVAWPNQRKYVHRYAYELYKGPIPEKMFVLHSCDTPACCNPDHLRLGTNYDNVQDMMKRKRNSRGEAHGAKLTVEQVKKIIHDPRPCTVVAKEYGIVYGHVSDIRAGKRWKEVYATEKGL